MIGLNSFDVFVDLTENARSELTKQIKLTQDENLGLRIFVMFDPYEGFALDLKLDHVEPQGDYMAKVDKINIIVDKTFLKDVKGIKIDYHEDIQRKGERPPDHRDRETLRPASRYRHRG